MSEFPIDRDVPLPQPARRSPPAGRTIVKESDVLIAAALWLFRDRGVAPEILSPAKGEGIAIAHDRRFREALTGAGIPADRVKFELNGPDYVGASRDEWWQVECKGYGTGQRSTLRNNFDRALASVVSCFGWPRPEDPD